ncbi:ATP-binding protein [Crenobacter sp. SG2305]|uniref:sensor histidine kinase n=1 Tax=Crenobacter oryzisoli TaxID=3056844 RepID=UPI0025AA5A98|nr:ATP-binding protein [Crenobacter sp. SG2305]MDN0085101.1 ATP-binding protein [Crenobacter sp. SG2305]
MGRLFWKILLGFWLTLLTVALISGTLSYLYVSNRLSRMADVAGGPRAAVTSSAAAAALHYGGLPALNSMLDAWPPFVRDHLRVVDSQGRDAFGLSVPPASLAEARRRASQEGEPPKERSVQTALTPAGQRYLVFVLAEGAMPHPLAGSNHLHPPAPLWPGPPFGTILIVSLGSLLFSAVLAWYLTRPLRLLSGAFTRLAYGDLETRVAPAIGRRRDEIADLGHDFDRMAERLKALVTAQRQLLHDVSHELRSPLGRLQVAVGLARQQPDKLDASLDRVEREAGRLDQLVGEILTLSQLEASKPAESDEFFDLTELLHSIVDDARFEAAGRAIAIDFAPAGNEALMRGRAELLHRALENIVRNALKHSSTGRTIDIDLHCDADQAIVRVSDRGPGVDPGQLAAMFEPFVQLDTSRTTPGWGLGLAIAQRAITAHHGTVSASNRPGGGLTVSVTLPLQPALPDTD